MVLFFGFCLGRVAGGCALLAALVPAALTAAQRRNYHPEPVPLPPSEAARTMIVPDGFNVTLFAGEPDVRQPIALCLDDRGRVWVAEAYQYPTHGTEPGRDRILIFEDTDGDGRHDRRTIFFEGLNYVSGLEVGFGGAWVMSPPFFYFIPDRDRDDQPDGPPVLLLDGFGDHSNPHNMANHLAWGPDGWLYGTHGRTNWSLPGKQGTPEEDRTRFDGGVWRYHPVRHVWEPYLDGTTNPWGIDWNDYGHGFICTSVDPHLYHVIQGAHHEPWRNRASSRYAYERIPTIADHRHFSGTGRVQDGLGTAAEDEAGGGHSHAGTMVYLGDNWPDFYRNGVFVNNIHGRRINFDRPARSGSGYTASHGPTLMRSRDPWYMGVVLRYGPDGAVYAADWSDTDECHSYRNTRKATGRIHRISYGNPQWDRVDLATLDDLELVRRQTYRNDWHVRHARRLLQERAAEGRNLHVVHAALRRLFAGQADVTRRLRALWALHVTGGLDDTALVNLLDHESEHVRAWAVQLLCEDRAPPPAAVARFARLAVEDGSHLVRLYLASALQRLPFAQREGVASGLLRHGAAAGDQNLPLMIWYGIQPLVDYDLERFAALVATTAIPLVRRHVARRASEADVRDRGLPLLVRFLGEATGDSQRSDLLAGVLEGLRGVRSVPLPAAWKAVSHSLRASADPAIAEAARELALVFGDPAALAALRRLAADPAAPAEARERALEALVGRRQADVAPLLLALTTDPAVRRIAIRSLAEYDVPGTASALLSAYPGLDAAARQDALQTLSSRVGWATQLLDAAASGAVSRREITAYTIRQIQQLGDPVLAERLTALWGELRPSSAEKEEQIRRLRRRLTPAALASGELASGRILFRQRCSSCHRLFDDGGSIGPDLTGAQRNNVDYLLENIVDPGAWVSRDFQLNTFRTSGGRVVSGFVVAENPGALTVQSLNEQVVIPVAEVVERRQSMQSMMPEGLLQGLTDGEIRDLFAYLGSPRQVPAPDRE